MGVWIEIGQSLPCLWVYPVTPCVGVWIEILYQCEITVLPVSLPAWECGLKCLQRGLFRCLSLVTPCVGVWIEILF